MHAASYVHASVLTDKKTLCALGVPAATHADAEEQCQDVAEPKHRAAAHGHDDACGPCHGRVLGLLDHMGTRIKSLNGVLAK